MIIAAIVNAIVFAGLSRVICGLAVVYRETRTILAVFRIMVENKTKNR